MINHSIIFLPIFDEKNQNSFSQLRLDGLFNAYSHLKEDNLKFIMIGHIPMTVVINLSQFSAGVCPGSSRVTPGMTPG